MISLIRRTKPGSGTTKRRSCNITRARVKHRTAGGVGSQSACFPDTQVCSLFISILQASVTAAPVRRKRHHRRTKARSVERNVCADHQRRNYETDPILRALNDTDVLRYWIQRTHQDRPRIYYDMCTARASCVRHIAHASSANERPTFGLFFFALTFDDAAPPTRTRDAKSSSAPSSSPSPWPSPMAAAFRLAAAVLAV